MSEDKIIKMLLSVGLILAGCLCIGASIDKHSWSAFCTGIGCIVSVFYLNED